MGVILKEPEMLLCKEAIANKEKSWKKVMVKIQKLQESDQLIKSAIYLFKNLVVPNVPSGLPLFDKMESGGDMMTGNNNLWAASYETY